MSVMLPIANDTQVPAARAGADERHKDTPLVTTKPWLISGIGRYGLGHSKKQHSKRKNPRTDDIGVKLQQLDNDIRHRINHPESRDLARMPDCGLPLPLQLDTKVWAIPSSNCAARFVLAE